MFLTTYGGLLRYPYFVEHIWPPLLSKAGPPYRTTPRATQRHQSQHPWHGRPG